MTAYYNEIDPYAAQWLRNLIAAGHIASGDVDERSIRSVGPGELEGYTQCHFFAGIGGWSLALRLAGWDDARPVWTGSCPCQPFSAAGAGKAGNDERHLWPAWFSLISQRSPPIVFGEQVEAAIGWGWLDAVFADLEGEGYACGATVLPACGVGAPHIRARVWFVAYPERDGERPEAGNGLGPEGQAIQIHGDSSGAIAAAGICGPSGRMGNAQGFERGLSARSIGEQNSELAGPGEAGVMGDPDDARLQERKRDGRIQREAMEPHEGQAAIGGSDAGELEYSDSGNAAQERAGNEVVGEQRSALRRWPVEQPRSGAASGDGSGLGAERIDRRGHGADATAPWDCEWIRCTDGKARPVEPGTFPLAHGIPGRVGRLRAYGNAIVPQVAAEFIAAYRECQP